VGNAAGFALLNQPPPKVGGFSGGGNQQAKSMLTLGGGYAPSQLASSNWMGAFKATKAPVKGYTPPAFPEALNANMPYSSSSAKPAPPYKDTSGDILGSLGASLNNAIGQGGFINLSNAIPWAMERVGVAAKALADAIPGGIPLPGIGNLSQAIDTFAGATKAVAAPVTKVMEALPNMWRDQGLTTRTETYRDFVVGTGSSSSGSYGGAVNQLLFQSLEGFHVATAGSNRTQEQQAMARTLAAGMIDLPDSVKKQIADNPTGDLQGYLDKAPEGRQLTYQPGFNPGAMVGMGAAYGLEMLATGGLSAVARGGALGVKGAAPFLDVVGSAGPASAVVRPASAAAKALQAATATRVGQAAVTGLSVAAKIQKAALISGIGYFPLTTLADTVLRTMGNKDGVAYLDYINRTTPISSDPNVQVMTAFSVNPISAFKAALGGELRMIGVPTIRIDMAIGRKLGSMYTSETALFDRMGQMYHKSRAEAAEMIGPGNYYETKGDAFNHILGLAGNTVADKLPAAEKMVLNALPDTQRTATLMSPLYIKRVLYEFDHPTGLVAQFKSGESYRDAYGVFDPVIAADRSMDFRGAMHKSYAAREAGNAVVGTVDVLNPDAQVAVRDMIETTFADHPGTLRDLNMLAVKNPSLDGNVTDLIAKGGPGGKPITQPLDLVPREIFDEALKRATDAYDVKFTENPVRTATGVDPVLRPGVHLSDWAAAFNTTEDTIKAITTAGNRLPAQDALIATFLRDKNLATGTELIGSSADVLFEKALNHITTVSEPWVKRGGQVDLIEAEIGKASERLQEVTRRRIATQELASRARRRTTAPVTEEEIAAAKAEFYKYRSGDPGRAEASRRLTELEKRKVAQEQYGPAPSEALSPAAADELKAAEADVGFWQGLLGDVRDPITTMAERMKSSLGAEGSVTQAAARKVDAMGRVEEIQTVRDTLAPAELLVATAKADLLHSVKLVDGQWRWAADEMVQGGPVFDAAVERFKAFKFSHPNERTHLRQFEEAQSANPAYAATAMADSEGFLASLRKNPTGAHGSVDMPFAMEDGRYSVRTKAEAQAQADRMVGAPDQAAARRGTIVGARPKQGLDKRWYVEVQRRISDAGVTQDVTNGQILDMIAGGKNGRAVETQITPGMIEALGIAAGPEARAQFIARVGSLREAFDTALSGKTEAGIGRTAAIRVSDWAVQRRLKGEVASLFLNGADDAAHAEAVLALKDALDSDAFPAVRAIVEGDPLLRAQARKLTIDHADGVHGWSTADFLKNRANANYIRTLVTPVERRVPGVPLAETDLGAAILAGVESAPAVMKLKLAEIWDSVKEPLHNVPVGEVDALASAPRLSVQLTSDLNEAGIHWNALIPETLWAKSDAGMKALSAILNLNFHQPPQTIRGLLTVLRDIENGTAGKIGMGPQLQAEAAALGERVVRSMIGDARRADLQIGVIGKGEFLNPATASAERWGVIKKLIGDGNLIVTRDEQGLQYGLKARPIGHKVEGKYVPANPAIDMERMPAGFAEELLTGHFQPFSERIVNARTRQAFARLFTLDNQQITYEARARFEAELAKVGIPAQAAEKIWSKWRETAKTSRSTTRGVDKAGHRQSMQGDSALYATEKNIPNAKLEDIADAALADFYAAKGGVPEAVQSLPKTYFSDEMRRAGSFTRRNLAGLAEKNVPLAAAAESIYGLMAHNQWVTTMYYLFRFQLDARFHVMNKFEGPFLYGGRNGLKTAEIDQGMIGMTREFVNRGQTAGEAMEATGYPFAVTRQEYLYKDLLMRQPDALRGFVKANPELVKSAVQKIAERDPQMADMLAYMGDDPNSYLRIMDSYYNKIMKSADPEAVIDAELMKDLVNNPELEAVYGKLSEVNAQLLGDLRSVYYGNPARGQIERVLNNYLVYWPLSYQIKATKWLLNIMYGKIGGVQTGGLGALALDRMQADHERLLVEDPEYGAFFEKHPTLVFAAQMLVPITPNSLGVGLNPILRNTFFGGTKNAMEVGPIYSWTKLYPSLVGELYQDLKDVPGVSDVAAAAMRNLGRQPPAPKPAAKVPLAP
jgi:hypothetical protein